MGSGTSRGKKVAPACVGEVKVTKTTAGVPSPKQDSRPFKPPRSHGILRNARNRAPPDCHSEGHDSDFSREEDDGDGGVDTVLADYEGRGRAPAKKNPPKKIKTYGLCHFSQEDDEDSGSGSAPRSGAEEPRGSRGGTSDVNNRSVDAFTPARPGLHTGFLTRGALMEAVPASEKQSTFGSCHSSSLTTPVILYDGSEEELMDTIEKEFS